VAVIVATALPPSGAFLANSNPMFGASEAFFARAMSFSGWPMKLYGARRDPSR